MMQTITLVVFETAEAVIIAVREAGNPFENAGTSQQVARIIRPI